jgi:hypothetical protein
VAGATFAPTVTKTTPQPNTGSGRKTAAAVALGAPRSAAVTRAPKGGAAPKMPTTQKGAPKLPGTGKSGSRNTGKTNPGTSHPARPLVLNYGSNTPQEIHQIAKNAAQETLKAELAPLKSEGREVAQNEQGASQRYQQYSGAANQLLGGVAEQQAASAKTYENQAADNALQAGKAVETSGQTQASMTGGFVSPELRAQLNAEASRESAAGASGNTLAQNIGQAGQNLVSGIRSAAALRAVEGQGKITGYFQKEANKIGEAENSRIAKVGADQEAYESKDEGENVKARENLASLGLKTQETANKTAKVPGEIANKAAETQKFQVEIPQREADTRKVQAEMGKIKAAGQKVEQEVREGKVSSEIGKNRAIEAEDKARAESLRNLGTSGRKYLKEIQTAYSVVDQEVKAAQKANPTANPHKLYMGIIEALEKGAHSGVGGKPGKPMPINLIHAGLSMVYNGGKLVGKPAQEAIQQGLNPELLE